MLVEPAILLIVRETHSDPRLFDQKTRRGHRHVLMTTEVTGVGVEQYFRCQLSLSKQSIGQVVQNDVDMGSSLLLHNQEKPSGKHRRA